MSTNENISKSKKICIIEDDLMIQEIYKTELFKNGFDVYTASDGEEGLELINKTRPDLALIDIMMPKVDGISLMKSMQSDPDLVKIPIIVLTNLSDEETLDKIKGLQTHYYLIKSLFKPKDVVRMVKETLENLK